ncbi:MAG: ferredoxin [Mycobacteriales bacterium]|nr:ferredoxin [Frankia sp.]
MPDAPVIAPAVLRVRVDQDLCTGDGICAQLAPAVFELDVDGLAYVKAPSGELLTAPGADAPVPDDVIDAVRDSAAQCPGCCIFVEAAPGS